ncbi:MAG: hypothetical protein FJ276_21785 [Planctomycetes bacterium]|nr:hypothetical protein [Planctomycetota bacterium]
MSTHAVHLSDEQLSQLAQQIAAANPCRCRFSPEEARCLHALAQALENGGQARWQALMSLGESLVMLRKVGAGALITALVGAVVAALWAGIKLALVGKTE